jgi:hypothetical protein
MDFELDWMTVRQLRMGMTLCNHFQQSLSHVYGCIYDAVVLLHLFLVLQKIA